MTQYEVVLIDQSWSRATRKAYSATAARLHGLGNVRGRASPRPDPEWINVRRPSFATSSCGAPS